MMLKRHFARVAPIGLIALSIACQSPTQPPADDEPQADESRIFLGYVADSFGTKICGQWVDGEWMAYESGVGANVIAAFEVGGDILAAGTSYQIGGTETPCFWRNGAVSYIETPAEANSRFATGAAIVDGRLAISGYIRVETSTESSGTVVTYDPGYWIDGEWTALEKPDGNQSVYAYGIAQKEDDVIVFGGTFAGPGLLWTNGALSVLEVPSGYQSGSVWGMAIIGEDTYFGGYTMNATSYRSEPLLWRNGVPTLLGLPAGTVRASIFSLGVKNGALCAVASASAADSSQVKAVYWKSGSWVELPPASGKTAAKILGASPDDEDLFLGYSSDGTSAGSVPGYWEDGAWRALPLPSGAKWGTAKKTIKIEGAAPTINGSPERLILYTAGKFDSSRPILDANGLLLYDNSSSNTAFLASFASAACYAGTDVYFCGAMQYPSEWVDWPAYWKNGIRVDLDIPASALNGVAADIAVVGSNVYVAGYYTNSGGKETPCQWVNGSRTDLPIEGSLGGEANQLVVVGEDVYVAGYYIEIDASPDDTWKLCFWKNGTRTDIESVSGFPSVMVFDVAAGTPGVLMSGICESETDPGILVPVYWTISDPALPKTTLDSGAATKAGVIGLLCSGSDVYATGGRYIEGIGWEPVVWKNGTLSSLETVTEDDSLQTGIAMALDGTDLYVVGMRGSPSAGEVPALWKNGRLVQLSNMNSYGTLMDIAIRRY